MTRRTHRAAGKSPSPYHSPHNTRSPEPEQPGLVRRQHRRADIAPGLAPQHQHFVIVASTRFQLFNARGDAAGRHGDTIKR
ncbi:hypothetical protein Nham_0280 [Nitrobacter hamburgensis X14]|uniref:Uncharacterized protein n=1 Tax=Nitrobacter hamburgensis (strain DSM 10229 / NCIMB 13809 / X14) TaxID=323097 RepID=Q1QRG9_NITHX|nr:hypothetical protein Nham_0280 [Nitrobacter hamburgensis X14]